MDPLPNSIVIFTEGTASSQATSNTWFMEKNTRHSQQWNFSQPTETKYVSRFKTPLSEFQGQETQLQQQLRNQLVGYSTCTPSIHDNELKPWGSSPAT
jgi:hypothetical protein